MHHDSGGEDVGVGRSSARPSFNYNCGEVRLNDRSPTTNLCCKRARKFRVYHTDTVGSGELIPRGICCVRCGAEYLDENAYEEGVFDNTEYVDVHCLKMQTDLESSTDESASIYSIDKETLVFYRKVSSRVRIGRCSSFITMVNPNRRYLNHQDSAEIERLPPGTHVMWHRPYTWWHHLLIQQNNGDGKCDVIHFTTSKGGDGSLAEVREESDYDFTAENNGTAYEIVYDESVERSNPIELVLDRAISQLTEANYCLFTNNCEHMVTFCKTGTRQSPQVDWLCWKLAFTCLRIIVISIAIYLVTLLDLKDRVQTDREEAVEMGVVIVTELVVFGVILSYWKVLHNRGRVGAAESRRCRWEAFLEMIITVLVYAMHVVILVSYPGKSQRNLHILSGIGFGIVGKIAGCGIGQALTYCFCTSGPTEGVPTPRRYGRMEYRYASLVRA